MMKKVCVAGTLLLIVGIAPHVQGEDDSLQNAVQPMTFDHLTVGKGLSSREGLNKFEPSGISGETCRPYGTQNDAALSRMRQTYCSYGA